MSIIIHHHLLSYFRYCLITLDVSLCCQIFAARPTYLHDHYAVYNDVILTHLRRSSCKSFQNYLENQVQYGYKFLSTLQISKLPTHQPKDVSKAHNSEGEEHIKAHSLTPLV